MTEKPPLAPERRSDKGEESGDSPMRRFEDLTRGLLRVDPAQIKDEQARYEEDSNDGKRRPRLRTN